MSGKRAARGSHSFAALFTSFLKGRRMPNVYRDRFLTLALRVHARTHGYSHLHVLRNSCTNVRVCETSNGRAKSRAQPSRTRPQPRRTQPRTQPSRINLLAHNLRRDRNLMEEEQLYDRTAARVSRRTRAATGYTAS